MMRLAPKFSELPTNITHMGTHNPSQPMKLTLGCMGWVPGWVRVWVSFGVPMGLPMPFPSINCWSSVTLVNVSLDDLKDLANDL